VKRNLDLVRRILLNLEDGGAGASPSGFSAFVEEGFEPQEIHYHVRLLHDAGLLEADEIVPGQWWPERMTWSGHEFLDAARNEELWQETKRAVETRAGSAPFQVFHELLLTRLRTRLERPEAKRSRRPAVRRSRPSRSKPR
jgi:Hypothetical protein (DUF2513)